MPLSEHQLRVLELIRQLDSARDFVLAGGGAMILHGLTDRTTEDVDLFGWPDSDVGTFASDLRSALSEAGYSTESVHDSDAFVRIDARADGTTATWIDIARDVRIFDSVVTEHGPIVGLRELAADKVLALFGRGEPRDLLDVAALTARLTLPEMMTLAAQKDAGFDPSVLAEMINVAEAQGPQTQLDERQQAAAALREAFEIETDD